MGRRRKHLSKLLLSKQLLLRSPRESAFPPQSSQTTGWRTTLARSIPRSLRRRSRRLKEEPAASSDSEPEKETASEEIFSLTEVSGKKEELVKEVSAEEIMAMKEATEESTTPALA